VHGGPPPATLKVGGCLCAARRPSEGKFYKGRRESDGRCPKEEEKIHENVRPDGTSPGGAFSSQRGGAKKKEKNKYEAFETSVAPRGGINRQKTPWLEDTGIYSSKKKGSTAREEGETKGVGPVPETIEERS